MIYRILKSFKGSQDGRFCDSFEAGTDADLSDYLVDAVDKSWIALVIENKAITTEGRGRGRPPKVKE
jgi:hypothetical protein